MVGYAVFSESLNIGGTASTGSSDFNIIFSKMNGISEKGSSNATANIVKEGKELEISVPHLEYPTSYAEFDVTIKNEGELNAVLTGIETQGLDNPDIKVMYSGISQDEVLGSNQEKKMKIKVTWDETSTNTSANASFTITITYEQDTNNRPTTTLEPEKVYTVGEEFCLESECFYTIKDNGDTVTAFAKYNLDLNSNLQSKNSNGSIAFSQDNYWAESALKPKAQYGTSYPADVYDSNSLLYEHVENYENYLKTTLGKTSADLRLMTYNELISLGCSAIDSNLQNSINPMAGERPSAEYSCEDAQPWALSTSYWTGTSYYYNVFYVTGAGYGKGQAMFNYIGIGIRPVITISKPEI